MNIPSLYVPTTICVFSSICIEKHPQTFGPRKCASLTLKPIEMSGWMGGKSGWVTSANIPKDGCAI